jgi:hypothetical protein
LSPGQITTVALSKILIDPAKFKPGSTVTVNVRPCSQAALLITAREMYGTEKADEYAAAEVEHRVIPPRGYKEGTLEVSGQAEESQYEESSEA